MKLLSKITKLTTNNTPEKCRILFVKESIRNGVRYVRVRIPSSIDINEFNHFKYLKYRTHNISIYDNGEIYIEGSTSNTVLYVSEKCEKIIDILESLTIDK